MQSEPDVMSSTLERIELQSQPRSIASVAVSLMRCSMVCAILFAVGCSAPPPPTVPGFQPASQPRTPRGTRGPAVIDTEPQSDPRSVVGGQPERDQIVGHERDATVVNTEPRALEPATNETTDVTTPPPVPVPVGDPQPTRDPDPGVEAYRPSIADERHLASLVDLAFTRLMDGNAAAAIESLDDARRVDGWSQSASASEVLFWLGQCHEELGDTTTARMHYRQVLDRYPGSRFAKRARERLAALRGRE